MNDHGEAPPSFEELEPEGDYSALETFPSANRDRADQVLLDAIEEDDLEGTDEFSSALPAPKQLRTRATRPKASAQIADWDEALTEVSDVGLGDAEVDSYGDNDVYGDTCSDYSGEFEDDFEDNFDDALLPRNVLTKSASGLARPDRRAAGLLEDERLLKALSGRLQQTNSPAERAALVGALVPLALRAHPQVYGALTPLIPSLIRSLLAQTARPRKHLLSLLQKVVHGLAARAARGETLSAQQAANLVAAYTKKAARKAAVSKRGS